ncbi:MAG: hypothetical protein J5711_01150 [Bacteroidales bacterium]|nr:hypothetical protein [Bacteroidales bacterium]
MKKTLFITAIALLTLSMVSCHKEEENNNNSTPQDTTQTQKHNVELEYNGSTTEGLINISMDTIYKYNADKYVDTIFMIPVPNDQFATFNAQKMKNVVNTLRPRHEINPNKVFGKGDLQLSSVIPEHPEIVRFFADTLGYNVIFNGTKSR